MRKETEMSPFIAIIRKQLQIVGVGILVESLDRVQREEILIGMY